MSAKQIATDQRWMGEALAWSRKGKGWTSPRPSVGCVLVQGGGVIGGGHTQPGHGNPHAEIAALRAAAAGGHDVRDATAYVTLEPCCHHGTTPPCTDALIAAGVARVVCGVLDPNPAVCGHGYELLREAGIEVVTEFMAAACARAQDEFLVHITRRRPFVVLKAAMSLDGCIATASGESQWITGAPARQTGHRLRHDCDAVLVGIGTALADDPRLTVRLEGQWKQPVRIVLDSRGRLPQESALVKTACDVPLIVATTDAMPPARERELTEAGAQVWRFGEAGRIEWPALLQRLYAREICSVLIEGGPRVAGSALAAGIVDRIDYFVAPILLGAGRTTVEGYTVRDLAGAPRLHHRRVEELGDDILISGYLNPVPGWPVPAASAARVPGLPVSG